MVTLVTMSDLMPLWVILALAAVGGVAYLIYRFVPGIRPEKKDIDEKEVAKEELERFLQPMDEENVEVKPEVDDEEKPAEEPAKTDSKDKADK